MTLYSFLLLTDGACFHFFHAFLFLILAFLITLGKYIFPSFLDIGALFSVETERTAAKTISLNVSQ